MIAVTYIISILVAIGLMTTGWVLPAVIVAGVAVLLALRLELKQLHARAKAETPTPVRPRP